MTVSRISTRRGDRPLFRALRTCVLLACAFWSGRKGDSTGRVLNLGSDSPPAFDGAPRQLICFLHNPDLHELGAGQLIVPIKVEPVNHSSAIGLPKQETQEKSLALVHRGLPATAPMSASHPN